LSNGFEANRAIQRNERNAMLQRESIAIHLEKKIVVRFAASILFALLLGSWFAPVFAQQPGQQTFASPDDAGSAFFGAMQKQDDQLPLSILGQAGEEVLSSGDPAEDADARVSFVVKYKEMHRYVTEPNGTVTLVVGAENWPFPIPLVNKHGSWYFDTAAGKDEILFRRIGKNEIAAMDACGDLVARRKSDILLARWETFRSNSPRSWSATKAGAMVFTGSMFPMRSIVHLIP
jgi:hypothetical protein